MTWQLMKRDHMWRVAVVMASLAFVAAAAVAAYAPLPPTQPTREALRASLTPMLGLITGYMLWLASIGQASRELYEAGLPIAGRAGWLSRVLSLLSIVWLPVLSGIACELPPIPLLEVGAIYTALILGAKGFRVRELGLGRKLRAISLQILILGPLIAMQFSKHLKSIHRHALPSEGAVLAICGVASLALFQWGWNNVPKSFQIAAPQLSFSLVSETQKPSDFLWAPVFRSIYGRSLVFMAAFILGLMPFGLFGAGIFAAIPQASMRARCRWVLALPVSTRHLFGLIAAPPAVLTILGAWARVSFDTNHPFAPRARIVELGAELAFVYLAIFLSELPAWRRLSKVRTWIRWVPFGMAFLVPPAAVINLEIFQNLANALPGSWWLLGMILAIPVVASYWLAEKAFREREYRRPYVETVNASNEMRRELR